MRPPAWLLVLVVGMAASLYGAQWQADRNEDRRAEELRQLTSEVTGDIAQSMRLYEYGLRGTRGAVLTAGPENISRDGFRRYAKSRDLEREFPGARGFGFIRRVRAGEDARFLVAARRDGMPDFHIRQFGPNDGERYVIQYIEPIERNKPAIGLDIASEVNRRTAAFRSALENAPVLTGPITLVQAEGKTKQSFLLLLPVYSGDAQPTTAKQRESAVAGWVYVPLSADEILHAHRTPRSHYRLALRDLTSILASDENGTTFYSSLEGKNPAEVRRSESQTMEVFGRTWEVQVVANPSFYDALELRRPLVVAAGGAVVTLLLAALTWLSRKSAARSAELRAEQIHRAVLVESSRDAIIGVDLGGRISSWNPAAQRIFGYEPREAIGRPMDFLLPQDGATLDQAETLARIARGEVVQDYDTVRRTREGQLLDVSVSVVPTRDAGNRIIGLAKTIRDNSEKKAAERELQRLMLELEAKVIERTASLETARRDLRTILDALPSMVGYWDHQLRNQFANKAYEQWFGVAAETLKGLHMRQLLGDELFEANRSFVEAALQGEAQTFERAISSPDGSGIRHSLAHYLPDVVDGDIRGFYVLVHDVTELKRAQERAAAAQRDTESLLQTIHHHAIVSITDMRGVITDANEAFCEISGYTSQELIGRTHQLVSSGVHPETFWRTVWHSISRGNPWRGEICNRAKDGSLYWVDSIIAPFFNEFRKIERYISIRFDITARKRAQTMLQMTHQRLALAADAAGIGVWEFEPESQRLTWDAWMYRLYGISDAQVTPTYDFWVNSVHPEDRAATETRLRDCFVDDGNFDAEFRIRQPDGQVRHIRAAAKIYRNDSGTAIRLVGINWDISQRKNAELELASTTSLLSAVLASAGEVSIIATDPDLKIRVFNRGAERLLDYASEELVNQATPLLIHDPLEIESRAAALSVALNRDVDPAAYFTEPAIHGQAQEWTYVKKGGERFPVSLIVNAMRGGEGQLVGYLGIAYDVTAQREYQRALIQAKANAEIASLAKSQFLANMSHEIRTPMNAIIGLNFLLSHTPLNGEQTQFLDKMNRASKSLLGIINDVLDLSKIEAGELSLSNSVFRIRDLLGDLVSVLRVQANQKQLQLQVEISDSLPDHLLGDSLRLNQILTNLLNNAIKFTDRGNVRLSARALGSVAPLEAGTVRIRFEVEDTGIGISADSVNTLFHPFVQADTSITRRFGGTGLGLSIVRQLAHLMGGEVGLSSQLEIGSTFWLELPLEIADDPLYGAEPPTRPNSSGNELKGVRVLVVDDSEINVEVAKRVLEMAAAEVCSAIDGEMAVGLLQDQPDAFDIVLMDVHMPGMDGLQATSFIRKQLGLRLPILALTAGALSSHRLECEAAGMDDFVVKPISPPDLVARIRRHVKTNDAGAQAQTPSPHLSVTPNLQDWPDFPGLSAGPVCVRLAGDLKLFAILLELLVPACAALAAPVQSQDFADLALRLHKLRGGAGNVGATRVYEVATELEAACRGADAERVHELLPGMNEALAEFAAGATHWLSQRAKSSSDVGDGQVMEPDRPALESLHHLLKQQHVSAFDTFEAESPRLRALLPAEQFNLLRQQIEQMKFVEAARQIELVIASALGGS